MTDYLLSDVAEIVSGVGFPIAEQGCSDAEFPFLKVSDMNLAGNERLIYRWNNSISESTRKKLRARALPLGALIFPKIGAAIATNKKRQLTRPSCVDNNVMAVIPNTEKLDSDFLYYLFLAKNLSDFASDSNPPSIRKSDVERYQVRIPSLSKQRCIVDLLSRAEGIVRLRRDAEKKTAELIPALFFEMFGDPATNPKGWQTKTLDSVLTETKLGLVRGAKEMDDGKAFPYLRMDAVSAGKIKTTGLKRVDAAPEEVKEFSLNIGDFLFNTRNSMELVGKTGLFRGSAEQIVLFNNNLMRMRFDSSMVTPEYINALFQTNYIQSQLNSFKRGTTSVFAIYFKDLKLLQVRIPPLNLQEYFAAQATAMESVISLQSRATLTCQATFDALLAKTFLQ